MARNRGPRLPRLGSEATIAAWVVVIAAVALIAALGPQSGLRAGATASPGATDPLGFAPVGTPESPTPGPTVRSTGTPVPAALPAAGATEVPVPEWVAPANPARVRALPVSPAGWWPAARAVPTSSSLRLGIDYLPSGISPALVTLTGGPFGLPVSLWLDGFGGDDANASTQGSDFCTSTVTGRTIVLPWLAGCVENLRILLPSSVSCGTASQSPDAWTLAAAILANPGLGALDLGSLASTDSLPPGFISGADDGWVIDVPGTVRPFDAAATDPDRCAIDTATRLEVRGDTMARLILLDVGSQLVVIRLGTGVDGPSIAAARRRGYGVAGEEDATWAILARVHDLSFGVAAIRQ
jgi:hypothetical protein